MQRREPFLASNTAAPDLVAEAIHLKFEGSEDIYRAVINLAQFSFMQPEKAHAFGLDPNSLFLQGTPREQRDVIIRLGRDCRINNVVARARMINEIKIALDHRFGINNIDKQVHWMCVINEIFQRRTLFEMMTGHILFMRHAVRLLRNNN